MKAFRCLLCGDVYMGDFPPSHCPYCGAPAEHIAGIHEWRPPVLSELTEISRKNLEKSLQLEVNNSTFYRNVGNSDIDHEWQGIFKYLAKIEAEHAATIRKALERNDLPDASGDVSAKENLKADLDEVLLRETRAGDFYKEFLAQATEERVKQIFGVLIEIEAEHLNLAKSSNNK